MELRRGVTRPAAAARQPGAEMNVTYGMSTSEGISQDSDNSVSNFPGSIPAYASLAFVSQLIPGYATLKISSRLILGYQSLRNLNRDTTSAGLS